MAAGTLLTVLANIPWGQVVDNAPKVADAAVRLWKLVRRNKDGDAAAGESPASPDELLHARLAALEEKTVALEEQMRASSELIRALAEQNAQLVQAIERERQRLTRFALAGALAVLLLAAASVLAP